MYWISFLLILLFSVVQSDTLREQISNKLSTSQLDQVVSKIHANNFIDNNEMFIQDLTGDNSSNNGSFPNPYEEWLGLPDWAKYLFGSIISLLGFIIAFFGLRILRLSLFLMGGFIAAVIMWAILAAAVPNSDPNKGAIVYGTALGIWVVVGLILACCISLALFVGGAAGGVLLAIYLFPIALQYVWPANPLGNLILWCVIFGVVGGLIACCLKKPLMILATSFGGAVFAVFSITAMAGQLMMLDVLPTTWQQWTAFGGVIAVTVLGIIVQLACTVPSSLPWDNDNEGYTPL